MKQDAGLKPGTRGNIPDDLWVQEMPEIYQAPDPEAIYWEQEANEIKP